MAKIIFFVAIYSAMIVLAYTQVTNMGECKACCKDGRDGRDGKDGRDGQNGINGKDGKQGLVGKPGKNGVDGRDGINGVDGKDGLNGINGKDGKDGKEGKPGKDGKNGLNGNDGKDGNAPIKNWKECAWKNINDDRDHGLIKNCAFKKMSNSTYLKVVVSSAMRIQNCNACCKRWFVTFDGQECAPVEIDGIVYIHAGAGTRYKNPHRPRVITGHCKVSKSNIVNVALNVGSCPDTRIGGDAYTGWQSSTRIYIEEVEGPQS